MTIPKDKIDYIRERIRIEDIASRYIPSLKKKGKNYIGLCPFHKENTPSFVVSPDKQIFHCFGCNAGGNVFTLISKLENISFIDSVKKAGEMVGVIVSDEKNEDDSYEKIKKINLHALKFYKEFIVSEAGTPAVKYLEKRGLTLDKLSQFHIGYAPDEWDRFSLLLKKYGQDLSIAEKIGLVSKSSRGGYIDKFRHRLMFPIFDRNGNVIAFGGRVIDDNLQPKYLNSPESPVFQKRSILYGLHLAANEIKESDRAIIVEGYLDVIGCHINGIQNVVAPLGTSLTENHVKILSQLCSEIVLLFDSDSAGMRAAARSIEISQDFNINVKIAILPEGDPFDFVMSRGPRELMIIIDKAIAPVDFQIGNIIKNTRGLDKVVILKKLFDVIKRVKFETKRFEYIKKVAEILRLNEEAVRSDFYNYIKNDSITILKKNEEIPKQLNSETKLYRDLLELVLLYPELAENLLLDFSPEEIKDDVSRNIMRAISDLYAKENKLQTDKIFDFFQKGSEMDFLSRVLKKYSESGNIEDPNAAYTEIYVKLKLHSIDTKITEYTERMKNSGGDNLEYLAEIEILRREKEKLVNYMYNRGSLKVT
ncbi:MAG: DNA primase [Spirochaetes bacterium ADurb.Bin218]|nr:DNA primase [Spirochaetota bacterium]OQB00544.1 MAG: DNA primase [Spirochaetes bacterium ADurb.Bin218]HOQ13329.1 DNA primase [Spirochaetota bacterium]HOV08056.1 DNA primase [Spirochaetota bacterium]HPX90582.1 DNA primase [Spirochaetota bacterium]